MTFAVACLGKSTGVSTPTGESRAEAEMTQRDMAVVRNKLLIKPSYRKVPCGGLSHSRLHLASVGYAVDLNGS